MAYLDDLVIYSSTWQEHLFHVEQICLRLTKAGLTIKVKKMPISYGRVHLPWICDWKRNHKTGTEQIERSRDIPSTNYQEGCLIILSIDRLLQEIYS